MFSAIVKVGVVLLGFTRLANAASYKAGTTVNVDDIFYYVPSTPISSLGVGWDQLNSAASTGEDLIPLTIMTGDFSTFDDEALQVVVEKYTAADDVFSTGFLQGKHPFWSCLESLYSLPRSNISHLDISSRASFLSYLYTL